MRVLLLLLLLMPSLVHAQVGDGVAVCCGREQGVRNNLPPFEQRFSDSVRVPSMNHEPEASYPPSFGMYTSEDGGYNPGTGRHTIKPTRPIHETDMEWATDKMMRARGKK